MVNYDTVLIRFGELSTKGKNRKDFIKKLFDNIRYMLRDYHDLKFQKTQKLQRVNIDDLVGQELLDLSIAVTQLLADLDRMLADQGALELEGRLKEARVGTDVPKYRGQPYNIE